MHTSFLYLLRVSSCIARLTDNEVKDNEVGISIDPEYPSLDSPGNRSGFRDEREEQLSRSAVRIKTCGSRGKEAVLSRRSAGMQVHGGLGAHASQD